LGGATERIRIRGVDFSGAVDAGRKIWIASGVTDGALLRIEACRPAEALPGSGRDRERSLAAVRELIAREPAGVFGLDFPFALPGCLIHEESWEAFARAFAQSFDTPELFREACRAGSGGRELWRATDRETKTPFCAYNWRLYRQTYYGIRDLLCPLVREGQAAVLPMQPALPDRAWLLEICPATTLKQAGLYHPYKGRAAGHRDNRVRILEAIERDGPLALPASLRAQVLGDAEGDALDSVVAAFTAFRVTRDPEALATARHARYALEGYVYR
jgi:hypothetical protein